MTILPPSGFDYFTLTANWDTSKSVSFWDRFGDGGLLNVIIRAYGYGDQNPFGNPVRSRQFSGYLWNANVRANPFQYQAIAEIIEEQATRASNNQEAYLILSDRYNWYPKVAHSRYSRAVIPGTLETTRSPQIARLAFPVICTDFAGEPIPNLANANREQDYSLTFDLSELP